MNNKHQRTFDAIFADPINGAIEWERIEALLRSIGCAVDEGKGSAVSFWKDGYSLFTHRPHPEKESKRYRVRQVRDFLKKLGLRK